MLASGGRPPAQGHGAFPRPGAIRRASPAAVGARKDPDWRPRLQAVDNLASVKTKSGVDALVLALDDGEGAIALGKNDRAEVRWRETSRATEQRWVTATEKMRAIYEALGGEMFLDGYRKDGTVNTAHPLGGCRMADRGDPRGVVDANGESFLNENLFVVDGAMVPSALGTNPSLTIAAVAESIAVELSVSRFTRFSDFFSSLPALPR